MLAFLYVFEQQRFGRKPKEGSVRLIYPVFPSCTSGVTIPESGANPYCWWQYSNKEINLAKLCGEKQTILLDSTVVMVGTLHNDALAADGERCLGNG
jgi:hypothetical protein